MPTGLDAPADSQRPLQQRPVLGRVRGAVNPAAVPRHHRHHTLSWLHTLAWEGKWLPGVTLVRVARQLHLQNVLAMAGHVTYGPHGSWPMNSFSGFGHSPGQLDQLSTVGPSADMCRAPSMCQTSVPSLGYSSGKSLPAGSLHLLRGM